MPRAPVPEHVLPLRVWGGVAAVFLTLLALLSLTAARHRRRNDGDFRRVCSARLQSFASRCSPDRGQVPRIIALGSSLLARATLGGERMEALSRSQGGPGLRWLALTRGSSSIETFLPALDGILEARPELLLVEADLLYYRPERTRLPASLRSTAQDAVDQMKRRLLRALGIKRGSTPDPMDPVFQEGAPDPPFDQNAGKFRQYLDSLRHREPRGRVDTDDPLLAFLGQARHRGIQVLLLEVPRFWKAEKGIPASHRVQARNLRDQLEAECGVRTLGFPHPFPLDRYRDFSHLSQAGADTYSRWLLGELARPQAGMSAP